MIFSMFSSSPCVGTLYCWMLYLKKWLVCHLLIVAGRRQISNKEDGKRFKLHFIHFIIV